MEPETTHQGTAGSTVRERFAALGIPVPPPPSVDQQAEWDQEVEDAAEEATRFWLARQAAA